VVCQFLLLVRSQIAQNCSVNELRFCFYFKLFVD
jgi:hypothetical protein